LIIPDGSGAIIMAFQRDGDPLVDVVATSAPASSTAPHYDDSSSSTAWATGSTGAYGLALLAGVAEGDAIITAGAPDTNVEIGPVPVLDGVTTYVIGEIPAP